MSRDEENHALYYFLIKDVLINDQLLHAPLAPSYTIIIIVDILATPLPHAFCCFCNLHFIYNLAFTCHELASY